MQYNSKKNREEFTLKQLLNDSFAKKLSIIVAICCSFVFLYAIVYNSINKTSGTITYIKQMSNIKIYILTITIFYISLFGFLLMIKKVPMSIIKRTQSFFVKKKTHTIISLLTYLFILVVFFVGESSGNLYSVYTYYKMPVPFFCMFTLMMALWYCVSHLILRMKRRNTFFRMVISVLFLIVCSFFLYDANPLQDMGGGAYHIEAYIHSILMVCGQTPYSRSVTGIYGHYGLLLYIPVKILSFFTSELNAIIICVTIVGLATYLCCLILLDKLVKNDIIFAVGSLAFGILSFLSPGNYYQLFPHRVLFQAIILLYCFSYFQKHYNSKLKVIIGYAIVALSIVWNLETGIICLATWVLCSLVVDICRKKVSPIFSVMINLWLGVLSVLLAYIIVNICNIILGGEWIDISTFIYPIGSNEYNIVELLQVQLDLPLSNYFMAIALFLSVFTYVLGNMYDGRVSLNRVMLVCFSCMGLGVIVYYINRPVHGNLYIVMVPLIMCLTLIVDIVNERKYYCVPFQSKGYFSLISKVCMLSLLSMGLMALISIPTNIDKRLESSYEIDSYNEFINSINVPNNTAFVGMYSSLLYAGLNQGKIINSMDWEDINDGAMEYVWKQLEEDSIQYVFINNLLLEEFKDRCGDYSVVDNYMYDCVGCFSLIKKYDVE